MLLATSERPGFEEGLQAGYPPFFEKVLNIFRRKNQVVLLLSYRDVLLARPLSRAAP